METKQLSVRRAHIAGAYEHPDRTIANKSVPQVHLEVALGALSDAGLTMNDVDAYFCAGDAPGFGPLSMIEYMGLRNVRYADSTEIGGSSYLSHVGHAAAAIAAGKASVALITLAGLPRSAVTAERMSPGPEWMFEDVYGPSSAPAQYALVAQRHMYEYGTTSAQLAEVKVAASHHASFNSNAFLQREVTVEEVLESPMVSDPLHRLDCCVVTDGGGALVVVSPEIAKQLDRHSISVLGHGEAPKHADNGRLDLTYSGARWSGPLAFGEAGVAAGDIDYASIYDSFTITVIETIEDLGFCEKGEGGRFVLDGALWAPHGKLPFNTDGGGLCNNHPSFRGGITKVIEAVRQLRGEAHPAVQVPDCEVALAHGTGGSLANRMGSVTLILGRDAA
ncbi:thiolase domain-containing protein [Rhodococcus sp. T2V]|uniref:thiolase domain-containing protein n=1 Tax=Rhodococcus sp. T2V TaxID=3034164 RepID=UPI0023E2F4D2|nr:thiolase domain-containing protein [Rhodococcus sp. T2V]MDF3311870.1 thiolase domain-containing protein [Rhodococcus sp. T2V]